MDYLVIPVKDKEESDFFVSLLNRMKKKASRVSASDIEDYGLLKAIKEGEKSGKGSLENVKAHLKRVASGK